MAEVVGQETVCAYSLVAELGKKVLSIVQKSLQFSFSLGDG